jgi:cysteinyl-tRNA synthetase
MVLKVYNTLNRKKEIFTPEKEGEVKMYNCGPTVYWYQHIGNLRTYIFSDILKRALNFENFKVKQVINVTDVGHLTSDADEGEDKMEKAASKEGKSAKEIADHYFSVFKEDLEKLNISEPDVWCKATEYIPEQIELIKKLEKKGFTYKTSDGIYFDTSKLKDYGKLALLDISGLEAGKRVDLGEKKNKTDFALWKFSETPGVRQQEWNSPWGIGFPGWHVECSAMSSKHLGEQFDIHTGGVDHLPVHHTNELAQPEAAFGKIPWVRYWMHGEFLTNKEKEKISKSKGGLFTISELEKEGFEPLVYRYFCLLTHYRKQLIFSLEKLEAAKNAYLRLKRICSEISDDGYLNKEYLKKFRDAIEDDLNMPKALQELWNLLRDKEAKGKFQTVEKMDSVLGLNLFEEKKEEIPSGIKELVKERELARKNKEWEKSDQIREELKTKGFSVDDVKGKTIIKKL